MDHTLSCLVAMVCIIDGARFHGLEQFFEEVSTVLVPDTAWGRNLDAFSDILRGGFGTRKLGSRSAGEIMRCLRSVWDSKRRPDSSKRNFRLATHQIG
jgi:hypothetical protein